MLLLLLLILLLILLLPILLDDAIGLAVVFDVDVGLFSVWGYVFGSV